MTVPSVYLCGSITNAAVNRRVAEVLSSAGFRVFDPCEIVPSDAQKAHFSVHVYSTCKCAIEAADVLLVFLDSYGRDSAWEVGLALGLGKKLIVGLVSGSSLFLEDWMVKYSLDRLFVLAGGWLVPAVQSPDWAAVRECSEVVSLEDIPSRLLELIASATK